MEREDVGESLVTAESLLSVLPSLGLLGLGGLACVRPGPGAGPFECEIGGFMGWDQDRTKMAM